MNIHVLHKMRLITGFALIGSVVTGALFGAFDLSFDPRTLGVGVGVVAGLVKVF